MRRQVRPTLVVGVGAPGVHVAAEAMHLVHADLSDIPSVSAVALCDATVPLPATVTHFHILQKDNEQHKTSENVDRDTQLHSILARALDALYRVDAVADTRAQGWEIRRSGGGIVFLVVAQDALEDVTRIITTLQAVIAQQPARRLAVVGVILTAAGNIDESQGFTRFALALSAHHTCVEGIYAVAPTNVLGLTAASELAWERMIAQWIVEMVTTPLGLSVATLPLCADTPDTAAPLPRQGGFGLVRWQFPSHALAEWLGWRLQRDMLDHLLQSGEEVDAAVLAIVRDRCSPPSVMPKLPPMDLAANRPPWTHPDPRWIHELRTEIDAAATTTLAQASALTVTWADVLDKALSEASQALDAELAAYLAMPRAGCLRQMLDVLSAVRCAFLKGARTAETEAQEQEAQRTVYHQEREALGTALADAIQRFPAWSLRAWWRVVRRPWRWLSVFKTYREIVCLAEAYTACYEAIWLSLLRACEARWRASYAQALADDVDTRLTAFRAIIAMLAARRDTLTSQINATQKLDQLLEKAALPAQLKMQYYARNVAPMDGEVRAAFASSGGLWGYLHPDPRVDSLLSTLVDHAFERFAFLHAIRLDEMLVRTHSGEELRTRLRELVEAAAPFWSLDAGDDAATNGFLKRTWVGLPVAEEAQLVDLLPERGIEYYSTGNPSTITVTQIWWKHETQ